MYDWRLGSHCTTLVAVASRYRVDLFDIGRLLSEQPGVRRESGEDEAALLEQVLNEIRGFLRDLMAHEETCATDFTAGSKLVWDGLKDWLNKEGWKTRRRDWQRPHYLRNLHL